MADVNITRDGNEFLVRAYSPAGEEFVDDMFGIILSKDADGNWHQGEAWPERAGARVVSPELIDDGFFEEAEKRGIDIRCP
jgi:hypothetical protein